MDEFLIQQALLTLANVSGYYLSEESLLSAVNLSLPRGERINVRKLREHLNFAQAQGWVDCKATPFGRLNWFITKAGQIEVER